MASARLIASGLAPFGLVVLMLVYIFGPGSELLDLGVPLPEIAIEQVEFVDYEVHVLVRNIGPIQVDIVMADINDRIHPAAVEPDSTLDRFETALVRIPFDWNVAEPYTIGVTIDDGTRFERQIAAAAPRVDVTMDMVIFFGIIGTYVGVIPVMIGILWLPFIRRIRRSRYHFFLALTAGLLLFLALDSVEEALNISSTLNGFNAVLLLATTIVLCFLGLCYAGTRLSGRTSVQDTSTLDTSSTNTSSTNVQDSIDTDVPYGTTNAVGTVNPIVLALMISIGIGLHNFGEGLAIGAALGLGSIAFSTFLIVGFALHNTTEGIAIAAPLARERNILPKLIAFGMIAGIPAIFGAWVGGFIYSPISALIFLGVGTGAILQVIFVLLNSIRRETPLLSAAPIPAGIAVGMGVMYLTSILV